MPWILLIIAIVVIWYYRAEIQAWLSTVQIYKQLTTLAGTAEHLMAQQEYLAYKREHLAMSPQDEFETTALQSNINQQKSETANLAAGLQNLKARLQTATVDLSAAKQYLSDSANRVSGLKDTVLAQRQLL